MKTNEINAMLESVGQQAFGRSRTESLNNQVCVICGGPANEFKDELSKKEFGISAMCQVCQDSVFG